MIVLICVKILIFQLRISEELSELSDSGVDENGHTFIYTFGHASVEKSVKIGHDAAKMSVKGIQFVQNIVENIISKCINLVVFTIRSIVCTFSSTLLLVLYAFQSEFKIAHGKLAGS